MKFRIVMGIFMVILLSSYAYAQSDTVWFQDTCGVPGSDVTITIMAKIDTPGVRATELHLGFPPESLEFINFSTQGTLIDGWMVAFNDSPPGSLKIACAGTDRVSGTGPLMHLTFTVSDEFRDSFVITLTGRFETTHFPDTFIIFKKCAFNIEEGMLPTEKNMLKFYPNPFSKSLHIELLDNFHGSAIVKIFDSSGKEISRVTLKKEGGNLRANWNGKNSLGSNVTSGVYLISIEGKKRLLRPVVYLH